VGEIGTSPLYAFREYFSGKHGMPIPPQNPVGAASLIVWSLLLVVSAKYLFIILKLDNRGEGGILVVSTLIRNASRRLGGKDPRKILMPGLAGAALIHADGMSTPAISVLNAVDGLTVSRPQLQSWTVPLAVPVLVGLFSIQQFGTGRVAKTFRAGGIGMVWNFGIVRDCGIVGAPASFMVAESMGGCFVFSPRVAPRVPTFSSGLSCGDGW